ncbi:nitrate reductase cytochrome c-type subunit [Arenibacter algicola]|mgnify:CR=1 FL=1|jgi:cytochrome c-type protein NapB|uniref:Nitrate reductase cytochrome c-type subunit (NapB) n=1 Tax=Arenibacter algicola TaxID=616991 RepID=A0A221UXZ9_9FLAO|nr:nitrate reductase cytochrome c-type subunit [Arenibacter algicola]ASO06113.1 nitrate reductase cytochrome c-type subunit (NapB) [Arenibacter algicola]MDX1759047.1 nitrate reductase cytochrome c-type subunit [Arenibacter algicola]HCO82916.1 cytochrome C [Arenibacter sp.]|tara:strand:+ start:3590 stop:4306 length:717 start_codon:yes stop_codon:yes gene_type:complete
MKKRLGIISFFVIIFIAFIITWNYSYQEGLEEADIPTIDTPTGNFIPSESNVFKRFDNKGMDYSNMPIDQNHQRTLESYYDNRAYPGAPPSIPHPVAKDRSLGGNTCLQCHQNGGFVEKFNAYAPVTPHPEMINCRQCHVAINSNNTFKEFAFAKVQPPKVGVGANNAMPGSPPMIPHQLQMRENCISCHSGPSAPKEIRVSHPERINCRQCHLPIKNEKLQMDASTFLRQFNSSYEE